MFIRFITLAMLAGSMALGGASAHAQTLPPEAFARLPAISQASVSPDGSRIAWLANHDGMDLVGVVRLDSNEPIRWIGIGDQKGRGVSWASDNAILIQVSVSWALWGGQYEYGGVYLTRVDVPNARPLLLLSNTSGVEGHTARLQGVDFNNGVIYMSAMGTIAGGDRVGQRRMSYSDVPHILYSVDVESGRTRLVERGDAATGFWLFDESGERTARVLSDISARAQWIERRAGSNWREAWRSPNEDGFRNWVGLAPEGDGLAYISQDGRAELLRFNLETGETADTLLSDPDRQVLWARPDPYTRRIAGAQLSEGGGTHWFLPRFAEWEQMVAAALPHRQAHIVSWSRDHSVLVLATLDPALPREYYVFRPGSMSLDLLSGSYPELEGAALPARERYFYTARDGVRIPAYLTRPAGESPMPLVILPHGGPADHEVGGFDWMAHAISSRGYLVLQPDFRGSTGYGRAWERAGHGEWGLGVMQHDLTDGVRALISAGLADPDRVCIAGASYGGYAALAGAVFTPELYACAVAVAPVTDLPAFIAERGGRYNPHNPVARYWSQAMGGDEGRGRIRAVSPALHAERAQAPILLIHGRDDSVVPIRQSEIMERALRQAGRSVEFVTLDGEDHWLSVYPSRVETLRLMLRFIDDHIGEDAP